MNKKALTNLFSETLKCLRDELVAYAYRKEEERSFTEKDEYPIDKHGHACDDMRYYIKGMTNANTYFPISAAITPGSYA